MTIAPESHSWTGGSKPHLCNCIGCCPDCGACRTWSGHTPDYCKLLQRQARERDRAVERARISEEPDLLG